MPIKAILFGAIFAAWPVLSQAQIKIGTVDMQKVFEGYYKKKQADEMLRQQGADADKVIKGWEDDFKKANDEYRKLIEGANDQAVSADEREKRKKSAEGKLVEIRDIEKTYTQFRRDAGTRIDEMKRRWQERILQEIREVIGRKAKAGNFTIVLDTGNRFDIPTVLYSNGQNDMTDEVLSELNASAPAGSLTPAAKEENPAVSLPKPGGADQKPGRIGFESPGPGEQKATPPATKPGKNPKKP
ncbi:MAG: OmpH family outer membrane protein [Verrucomicrobia bacterium]|nr:OmpH family outer membrane protein [Verrucomicrobiota bacterium]